MARKSIELSLKHLKDENFGKIPKIKNHNVTNLSAPHIDSFNFFLNDGLKAALNNFPPVEFTTENGDRIQIGILSHSARISKPRQPASCGEVKDMRLFPKQCIELGCSYTAPMSFIVTWNLNDRMMPQIETHFADIPIMLMSNNCHLSKMTPEELVKHGELVNETGGYFIINGACRLLRLLIANRRNYPLAIIRDSWKNRDSQFSNKGIMIRCVSQDQTSILNVLHYLNTGDAKFEFRLGKEYFFIPLIMCLMALCDKTYLDIFNNLIKGMEGNMYFAEKIKNMMREMLNEGLVNSTMCRQYIGKSFRHKMSQVIPPWLSDEEVCLVLIERYILIHLDTPISKFQTLCMMARKLYLFIDDKCSAESVDSMSMQESQLGGHTMLQYVKEKIQDFVLSMKILTLFKYRETGNEFHMTEEEMRKIVRRARKPGDTLCSFLATGALKTKTGCGLSQLTGLTIVVDHLNRMRDLSHFRAIHRGSFFLEMRGLGPRRLTGDAWGFICPVHTPDGAPCGLLNHLAKHCILVNDIPEDIRELPRVLFQLGMLPIGLLPLVPFEDCYEVILDGGMIGHVPKKSALAITKKLRSMKTKGEIFKYTEVVLVHDRKYGGQYPGLFLFTSPSRMMRPVINLDESAVEYVGSFEQLYLNVSVTPEEIDPEVHTHLEIEKTALLSNIGKLIPFSDCNPIPRNMYQCQMGKQTMGTPMHNWQNQTTSKLYRLQYPQVPLVRNKHYDDINMEEFCMGFNAVVAIISYTGYDMEDAMILNKCSMERGFAHGQVYKSEFIDLSQNERRGKGHNRITSIFRRDPSIEDLDKFLDANGLPHPGTPLQKGDPYYCTYDLQESKYRVMNYKGEENCVVDKYSIMSSGSSSNQECQRVNITIRIKRNPIIGDKFASRSGQKGIMSRLYPMEDLPFSERGIVPDIIFNPHGIPSRMTAGKLLELVAGKCAAEFGKSFDSTPFEFDDENTAVDYFGEILKAGGFNYYGEDVLYSGVDGRMMEVQIYEGIVYYQRLRHMTADKWQVRATGPIDMYTHQPIKGRKKGGAIRFGEMERDCLISHGAVYTLKDRLLDCSDESTHKVCTKCGGLLSPDLRPYDYNTSYNAYRQIVAECSICGPEAMIEEIDIPYAFKYLVTELAGIGINVKLGMENSQTFMSKSRPTVIPGSDVTSDDFQ